MTYNFTADPMWRSPIPAEKYVEDLLLYPRAAEKIPRWLQRKIDPEKPLPEVAPGTLQEIVDRTRTVSLQLRLALPQGWDHARIVFGEIGEYSETAAEVEDIFGRQMPWSTPPEVSERLSELRGASRGRPEIWYKACVEIWYTGEENFQTFGSDEPSWSSVPPPEAIHEELRRANRFDYELPTWLTADPKD